MRNFTFEDRTIRPTFTRTPEQIAKDKAHQEKVNASFDKVIGLMDKMIERLAEIEKSKQKPVD